MATNASKAYNPNETERGIYQKWERSGFFNPDNLPGRRTKRFVISMPPPNVTGELHLGHAEGIAIQDAFIRFERMRGKKTLWVPGTDHAGIATQIMVERLIAKEGLDRYKLGREKFLERVWGWKDKYGSSITDQIKKLGASCDWSREAFTMDKNLSLAVKTAFKQLYDNGLIYRGKRLINWCPRCSSALSDLEVKYIETSGKLYSIRYPLTGTMKFVTVATTRPETMLGDTAVAVHPEDPRYKKLIGKTVMVPIIEREIPIIADRAVEKDFGTGAVKVTPAHDATDFEIGKRHKLASLSVIDENAKMTKETGEYYGMHVLDARRAIVELLEKNGHIEQVVDYVHNVAHCDRCGTPLEPLLSTQWFVSMKSLARPALNAVKTKKITVVPDRFGKVYARWLENIHDWTISRQLWWGHQIPVWYCKNSPKHPPIVSIETPRACPECKSENIIQDQDTLDTWFSSGLWTFSTLGWPKKTKDLALFHPTDIMETSWDILFFWVARMVMMSLKLTGQIPFKTIYLHGLVLDKDGKKMSKSKGTGIDPIPMALKYGTDAIRLSLILGTTPGQDFRMSEEKISHYRNFINKLWNIGRFLEGMKKAPASKKPKTLSDRWILSRLEYTQKSVTRDIERFRLSEAGTTLYNFIWHELADWYVEFTKFEKNAGLLRFVFLESLKLLHPFAPFVTETLWERHAGVKSLLMIASWPKSTAQKDVKEFGQLMDIITGLRTIRNVARIGQNDTIHAVISGKYSAKIIASKKSIEHLAKTTVKRGLVKNPTLAFPGITLNLPLSKEATTYLQKEVEQLSAFRNKMAALLSNKQFASNAPSDVIAENKRKLAEVNHKLHVLGKK